MTHSNEYRPDIDGLRAIAVLLVVFYHAEFSIFPGGFIGVDIFFVLSGYLITGIVDREIALGTFQLTRFYTRRIKRILPAFYCVVFACGLVGYTLLFPPEFLELAESTLAASLFVSNFYFGEVTQGYFAPEVASLPLLHTWSLSVEEQFYFLWPLSLMFFRKTLRPRPTVALMIALAAVSFAAAEIAARGLSDTVFYAVWSRAGELLIGALLAFHHRRSSPPEQIQVPSLTVEALATFAGFALILGPAVMLDSASVFPGLNALWSCLGIAGLIHLGRRPGALSHRLLHFSPMVSIGLISYALYLWHWPVFVFARVLRIENDPFNQSALIVLSFALATLSWRFIERPIRYWRGVSFRMAFFGIFAAPAVGAALVCLFVVKTDGWQERFSPQIREAIEIAQATPAQARGECFHLDEARLPSEENCLLGARAEPGSRSVGGPDALLWGDSMANHFSGFFDVVGRASGIQLRDVTMGGCPPLVGTVRLERRKGRLCRQRNDAVLELIAKADFETVYISGQWAAYLVQGGFLGDDIDMSLGPENSARVVRDGFERTISAVLKAGKRPIIVRNVPEMDFDPSSCALKNVVHPAWARRDCRMAYDQFKRNRVVVDDILADLRDRHPDLGILEVADLVCSGDFCAVDLERIPLYSWGNQSHLNMAGSRALGRAYLDQHGPL